MPRHGLRHRYPPVPIDLSQNGPQWDHVRRKLYSSLQPGDVGCNFPTTGLVGSCDFTFTVADAWMRAAKWTEVRHDHVQVDSEERFRLELVVEIKRIPRRFVTPINCQCLLVTFQR